jgi:hypothetical protein
MHEVSNVFVTDGSCMPSIACQNPSLTLWLWLHAADYAVKEEKRKYLAIKGDEKIKMGMIGGGKNAFIGAIHRIAANMD